MVFNATLKNISVILWLSVWLVEETGVPGVGSRLCISSSLSCEPVSLQVVIATSYHDNSDSVSSLNRQDLVQSLELTHYVCNKDMVFNATLKNISVILWLSVWLVEETGVPWENHWLVTSPLQTLSHNVSNAPRHEWESN
jgi:hypothetical protein